MPAVGLEYLLPYYVALDGWQEGQLPANPALGAAFFHKVGADAVEIPVTVSCILATSATVITRTVQLSILNSDGGVMQVINAFITQAASLSTRYTWSVSNGSAYSSSSLVCDMPMVAFVLLPGWQIAINGINIQAGDQFSSLSLVLQKFSTGHRHQQPATGQPGQPAAGDSNLVLQGPGAIVEPVAPLVLKDGTLLQPVASVSPTSSTATTISSSPAATSTPTTTPTTTTTTPPSAPTTQQIQATAEQLATQPPPTPTGSLTTIPI